jgi:HPt (histidine-containing phosphotransfer) domain-containing protein
VKPRPKQAIEPEAFIPVEGPDEVVLPDIAGINIADGLKRVAGNKQLYRDLLGQFAAKEGNSAAQISTALEGGDLKLAERIAHTVKGIAGNLGINEVESLARKLEIAIRDRERILASLDEFASLMSAQVHSIEDALCDLGARQKEAGISPVNVETAADAIAQLKTMLEASDGDALQSFRGLQDAVSGVVEKQHLDGLSTSINNFDFDSALVKLDEIAKRCAQNGGNR